MNSGLFSYLMKIDDGFSPSPFGGFLTLFASDLRPTDNIPKNSWIAGFSSYTLNRDEPGEERLVYLMQLNEIITFDEYWNNEDYSIKIPEKHSKIIVKRSGNNIYMPLTENFSDYHIIQNIRHNCRHQMKLDLYYKYVFLSDIFYYFGSTPIHIPEAFKPDLPKNTDDSAVPANNTVVINNFLAFIRNNFNMGIYNSPHTCNKNDYSWKRDINCFRNTYSFQY